MMKSKSNMYLSELFLVSLGNNYSIENLKKALKICNKELLKRIKKKNISYKDCLLFYKQELTDFYDVFSEFEEELDVSVKNQFLILQYV